MIYLDYAAATPVSKKALSAMEPYFSERFFNPSSPYFPAKQVRDDYQAAKSAIAGSIGAKGEDLIITSGATESINLAFTALDIPHEPFLNNGAKALVDNKTNTAPNLSKTAPEVLILATEHAAVRAAASPYRVQEIAVDRTGLIDLDDFRQKLTPAIRFVSISLANNELGTIQPLAEIAEIIRKERLARLKNGNSTSIYLHSDASQALYLLDVNVARLGVDLLTLNAAKVYGPKGVGALYVARGIKLSPLIRGGGQEQGLRSGTENVPGVIGFAAATIESKNHLTFKRKRDQKLSNLFKPALIGEFSTIPPQLIAKNPELKSHQNSAKNQTLPIFLGNPKHQLANFCPICLPGIDAERLIYHLEEQEIYLSTGAACAASKGAKSKTLTAIGLSDPEIQGSLRIVFGDSTTEQDLKTAARAIKDAVVVELERLG